MPRPQATLRNATNPAPQKIATASFFQHVRTLRLPRTLRHYQGSIEHGLKPRSKKRFISYAITLFAALPLAWWINSNAFYEPLQIKLLQPLTPTSVVEKAINTAAVTPTPPPIVPAEISAKPPESADVKIKPTVPISPVIPPVRAEWLTVRINAGDTLSGVFEREGLKKQDLSKLLAVKAFTTELSALQLGQQIRVKQNAAGDIETFVLVLDFDRELVLKRKDKKFVGQVKVLETKTVSVAKAAVIERTLSEAAQQVGLPHRLMIELVNIFRWDVDFLQNIQAGDRFSVVYTQQIQGDRQREGDILAAEFVNRGKSYRAVRYTHKHQGKTAYYTPTGESLEKAFLRAPIEFARITSTFGMRLHPILNRMVEHKGIDYSAPTGTPIFSVADGVVETLERQRGYGRVIVVKHSDKYATLYAHLSEFAENLNVGDRVKQGQVIGAVGQSGLATAPHLHYEFHVDGVYQDPLSVDVPTSLPLEVAEKQYFLLQVKPLIAQLEAAAVVAEAQVSVRTAAAQPAVSSVIPSR